MKEAIVFAKKLIRASNGDDQKIKSGIADAFPEMSADEIQQAIDSAWQSIVKKFEKGR